MSQYIERFSTFLDARAEKFIIINNSIFRLYNHMILPLGPAKQSHYLSKGETNKLFKFFNSYLIQWHSVPNKIKSKQWYAVICDEFLPIKEIPSSNMRNQIRKGLKNCVVNKIDAKIMSNEGYEVYINAFNNYKNKNTKILSKKEFVNNVKVNADFKDIIDYWGVYVNNKLVAYAENYIYDNLEANYSTVKFDPDYIKYYSSYALFYKMNEYYLENHRVEYVSEGYRSLSHETNIQNYLINKFNFKKLYLQLNVEYRQPLRSLIILAYPFRKILSFNKHLSSLLRLEKIKRDNLQK